MIQVITPTGDRPEAFELCQRWMRNQTYRGELKWHIVDDGNSAALAQWWEPAHQRADQLITWHRLPPMDGNSQHRNMLHLLAQVDPKHPVVIWEDDDYYAPTWLETVAEKLRKYDIVGQRRNRYYNVRTGATKVHRNLCHASLCATALKGLRNIHELRRQCAIKAPLIDIGLWRRAENKHLFGGCEVVGIKGMPGRGGIAGGHDLKTDEPFDLSQWIGDDAKHYARFLQRPQ